MTCNAAFDHELPVPVDGTPEFEGVLFPHPLKKPPVEDEGGVALLLDKIGVLLFAELARPLFLTAQGSLGLGRWPLADGAAVLTPSILLKLSSFPLTSSSSCRATASDVFELTSSSNRASSAAGLWSSVASTACMLRLLERLENVGEACGDPN